MTMIVRDASVEDVLHVARHLREEDRREQLAARFDDDVDALAADVVRWRQAAISQQALCTAAGEPAVIVGVYLTGVTVGRFHMMSTPRLAEIAREGHRWGKRRFIPTVMVPNCRMVETRILADHVEALRWVRACGFIEGGIYPFGKNGEWYVTVVWLHPSIGREA